MKAKELKEILKNVPDEALIILSDTEWERSEIVGHQFVEKSLADNNTPALFLDIDKPFKTEEYEY